MYVVNNNYIRKIINHASQKANIWQTIEPMFIKSQRYELKCIHWEINQNSVINLNCKILFYSMGAITKKILIHI